MNDKYVLGNLLIYVLNYIFTFSLSCFRKKYQSCERKLAYVCKCQDHERLEEIQMKKFLQLHEWIMNRRGNEGIYIEPTYIPK